MRLPLCATKRLFVLSLALLAIGCGKGASHNAPAANIHTQSSGESSGGKDVPASATVTNTSAKRVEPYVLPVVIMETTLGSIKIRLRDDKAPRTVENFLDNYVSRGFYDKTIFHHVEKGFMIAAGGYTSDLQPKATRAWIRNESNNGLSNKRGTVAMAHHPDYPHSATSQFFINLVDNPSLDYRAPQGAEVSDDAYGYCVFGEVLDGMDVVDRIAEAEVHSSDMFPSVPVEAIVIESVRRGE